MQKTNYSRYVILTSIFLSISGSLYSQPTSTDYFLGYGSLAIFVSSDFLLQNSLNHKPNWVNPNSFDEFFRDNLKWKKPNTGKAAFMSDILLRGIMLPSIFVTPLITDYNYSRHLLINIQTVAATGLLTQATKFFIARQRPDSFFNKEKPNEYDDFLSFFSGHTSFTFAIATSTATILEKDNRHNSALIWSSALFLASATGYLRIAADRHYMTDVLTGAIIGSLTGYLISKNQSKRFFKKNDSKQNILLYFSLPL